MDPKLPWGVNQIQPGSMKTISDSKLAIFAVGQQKKTRFQKSREEKEQKVKEEEAAAAKIFDSFVASFTVEEGNAKTFVRGGEGKEAYKLEQKKGSNSSSSSSGSSEMDSIMQEIMNKEEKKFNSTTTPSSSSSSNTSSSSSSSSSNKKERQIDDFLSEIKAKQENKAAGGGGNNNESNRNGSNRDRDHSNNSFDPLGILSPAGAGNILLKGSFDDGDPHTTNIYVGNLAPTVTEEHLHELFGRYGDINSVKVMWPRTDEEKARKRNCGFVSFMRRADAEDAKIDLQDYNLEGNKMAVSWGKAVKINSCPFILPPPKVPLPAVSRPQSILPPPPTPFLPPTPLATNQLSSSSSSSSVSGNMSSTNAPPPPPQFLPPPPFSPHSFLPAHPPLPPSFSSSNQTAVLNADNSLVESKVDEGGSTVVEPSSTPTLMTPTPTSSSSTPSSSSSLFPVPNPILPPPPPLFPPTSQSNSNNTFSAVGRSKWDSLPIPMGASTTTAPSAAATAAGVEMGENDARIQIIPPVDKKIKDLIDLTAKFVAADGNIFEKSIKVREESNPDFAFLYDLSSSDHQYYRWRVFANIMGDTDRKWFSKPFRYNVHGIFVVPPEPPAVAESESDSRKSRRRRSASDSRSVSRGRDHRGRGSKRSKHDGSDDEDKDGHRRNHHRSHSHSRSPDNNNNNRNHHHRHHHHRKSSRSRSTDRKGSNRNDNRSDNRLDQDAKTISDRVKYAGMTGAQIERARAKERSSHSSTASLSDEDYHEWKSILASLTLHRSDIKYAMGFVYDKIDSQNGPAVVSEICYLLKKSLCNKTTPPAIKIARLYLLSDILHNSAAPIKYASNFRVEIQNLLPQIFEEELGAMRRSSALMGRMTAYQVDERVKRLLAAWEEWSLLSYTFIMGLEAAFYQSESDYNTYKACVESSLSPSSSSSSDSTKMKEDKSKEGLIEKEKTEGNVNDNNNHNDEEEEEEDQSKDFEHYKRQAKLSGVYVSPQDSKKSLKWKLQQYQNYQSSKYKLNSATFAPTAQQMAARILGRSMTGGSGGSYTTAGGGIGETEVEYNIDDDDIDGAPISQHTLHHLPLLSALNKTLNNLNNDDDDDDDDIDGVPLDFADHLASLSAAHNHTTVNSNQYNDDDDDVDGIPMPENVDVNDDDDEDIDGIPL